jgi:hypothetical protein
VCDGYLIMIWKDEDGSDRSPVIPTVPIRVRKD